jgi:hypothetical protein
VSDPVPKPTAQDLRDLLEAVLDATTSVADRRNAVTLLRAELARLDADLLRQP